MLTRTGLYALLSLVCLTAPAVGQTLHFILFADTNDPDIGSANAKTHTVMAQDIAPAIAKQANYTLDFASYTGNRCRATELDAKLNSLNVSPKDVIFFYFAGHGWNNRQNEYPSLILGNANTDRTALEASSRNLLDVYDQLRKKGARLTIAIGEACNRERSDAPPKPAKESTSSREPIPMKNTAYSLRQFEQLFGSYQGGVVMASSQRGQLSNCDTKGGLMSIALKDTFRQLLIDGQKGELSWEHTLDEITAQTEAAAVAMGVKQTPFYKLDLRLVQPDVIPKPPVPGPPGPDTQPCAPPETYVNETALEGIREDLPLLRKMNENVNSNNANQYARQFLTFYGNQKAFYDRLGRMVFYESSTMPNHCRSEFQRSVSWIQESTRDINDRYRMIEKFAQKPLQLAAQARTELPVLITLLEDILEHLDK